MAKIVSLGSALQDIFLIDRDDFTATEVHSVTRQETESLFGELRIGTKVDIDRLEYEVGGGGTNAAVEFARHGHESIYLGNIGHDAAGAAVMARLQKEGVDTSKINYSARKHTGCSIIMLDAHTGERTIMTYRGASAKFDNLDPNCLDELKPDYLYVTSLRGDFETLESFFKKAKKLDTKIMFNPGKLELKKPQELTKLLKYVDILLVNKVEAAEIVPGKILVELLSRLINYVPTVIITDGNSGAVAATNIDNLSKALNSNTADISSDKVDSPNIKEAYLFGIYEDVPVKDTTGAGDAFGSGFLAHLAAGHSFKQSLIFGNANSTSVITKFGAKAGLLTGEEDLHPMPIQKIKELERS